MECVGVIHSLRQGEKSFSQRGVSGGCQKRRCVVDLLYRGQRRSTRLDQIEMFTHWIMWIKYCNVLNQLYLSLFGLSF